MKSITFSAVCILGCVYETIQCINQQNNVTAFLSTSQVIYTRMESTTVPLTPIQYKQYFAASYRITFIGSMIVTLGDCDLKKTAGRSTVHFWVRHIHGIYLQENDFFHAHVMYTNHKKPKNAIPNLQTRLSFFSE